MKSVGVKDLKNNLSRYLHMVQDGELVYVTDRDEIVAEIHRPTTPVARHLSRWECFLNDEERGGTLKRARMKKSRVLEDLAKMPRWPSDLKADSLLDEVRGDRF